MYQRSHQSDERPPDAAHTHPDEDIENTDRASNAPPGTHGHVSGTEHHRCGTVGVVGEAGKEVAESVSKKTMANILGC